MNGQTGEVVGKAPWSVWKIVLFTIFCLAVVGALIALYAHYHQPSPQRPGTTQPVHAPLPPAKPHR